MNTLSEILIAALLLLSIYTSLLHYELQQDKTDIATYQQQIETLHAEALALNARTIKAESIATQQMTKVQSDADKVMSVSVPHDCDDAIKWGLSQAKEF